MDHNFGDYALEKTNIGELDVFGDLGRSHFNGLGGGDKKREREFKFVEVDDKKLIAEQQEEARRKIFAVTGLSVDESIEALEEALKDDVNFTKKNVFEKLEDQRATTREESIEMQRKALYEAGDFNVNGSRMRSEQIYLHSEELQERELQKAIASEEEQKRLKEEAAKAAVKTEALFENQATRPAVNPNRQFNNNASNNYANPTTNTTNTNRGANTGNNYAFQQQKGGNVNVGGFGGTNNKQQQANNAEGMTQEDIQYANYMMRMVKNAVVLSTQKGTSWRNYKEENEIAAELHMKNLNEKSGIKRQINKFKAFIKTKRFRVTMKVASLIGLNIAMGVVTKQIQFENTGQMLALLGISVSTFYLSRELTEDGISFGNFAF